ncbi:MAG TPA: hypothetical protein VFT66_04380, partial [Roseiflexaceae bacterium]|nr:hypothetical protein [Roseiflexaceae bacterium]
NEDIREVLDYIGESLIGSTLLEQGEPEEMFEGGMEDARQISAYDEDDEQVMRRSRARRYPNDTQADARYERGQGRRRPNRGK